MKSTILALTITALGLVATPALAGPINARQINQERLIDAGERSGKLTRGEANMLNAEQRTIRRLDNQLHRQHGGHLTKRDHRILDARQDRAEINIRREKNDRQRGRNHLDFKKG